MNFLSTLASRFGPTDEQVMWRVQARDDHRAFAILVERWERPVRQLCSRMVGDPHLGEDLMQITFTRVFEHRRDYRPAARFSTYLWRVALNVCYDELRRLKSRRRWQVAATEGDSQDSAEAVPAEQPGPDELAVQQEEGELVRGALARLPEPYRVVLVLRHYQGLKLREIADILEVPEGTVNSRMAEALSRLARSLAPDIAEARVASQSTSPNPLCSKENLIV